MEIERFMKATMDLVRENVEADSEVKYNPTYLLNIVFDLLKAIYPNGSMVRSGYSHADSRAIYNQYPEYLSMRHAWERKRKRFMGLEYPTVRPIRCFLRDVELKNILSKHNYAELYKVGDAIPYPTNQLEDYKRAIQDLGVVPPYYPAEISWTTSDHRTDYRLTVTLNMNRKLVEHISIASRVSYKHGVYVPRTLLSLRNCAVDWDVYNQSSKCQSHRMGIDLSRCGWLVDDIKELTRQISNSEIQAHGKIKFLQQLTDAPTLPLHKRESARDDSFITEFPDLPNRHLDWSVGGPTPGQIYRRWTDHEVTYVGLFTNKSIMGGLGILWFALKYEDDGLAIYIMSDKTHLQVMNSIPLRTICGKQTTLGYPINMAQWYLAEIVIQQLTRVSTGV